MSLHVYCLVPDSQNPHDWTLCRPQGAAIVQARGSGEARAIAADAELAALGGRGVVPTQAFASGFMNPALYTVHQLRAGPRAPLAPRLLRARFDRPEHYLLHRD